MAQVPQAEDVPRLIISLTIAGALCRATSMTERYPRPERVRAGGSIIAERSNTKSIVGPIVVVLLWVAANCPDQAVFANDLTVKAQHEAEGGFPQSHGLFNQWCQNRLRVAR